MALTGDCRIFECTMLDGIYYHNDQFFRFYKDGTLLHVLIRISNEKEDLKKIAEWFKKGHQMVSETRYTSKGGQVSFSIQPYYGDGRKCEYSGKASAKELMLDSLNHNNGKKIKGEKFTRL